ncbi:MAG: phosphoribosyltransferase family protein [Cocleimonas sp.]
MNKIYISANELLQDSYRLGINILNSGFKPDYIVGIWRGGTPVGIAVQEILHYLGVESDHIAIRTSSYYGIGKQERKIKVHGLEYILNNINHDDNLLLVDDVYDSGRSVQAVIKTLHKKARRNTPDNIRIAVPWFKPNKNVTGVEPEYYLHTTDDWLVFPHELDGLTEEEIFANKPGLAELLKDFKK